jgi:isoleucyl-tRNA synthetase
MSFKKVDAKVNFPKLEEEIVQYWEDNKIFEKSVAKPAPHGRYAFYDGPPFATGTPHYGHIVASTIKDLVPRYWTMRGYQVERKWGWDCHGLPIENIAEKELGITHKKEIEKLGVAKFNEICRSKVLEYVDEWKKVMRRFGRFADMKNAYRTMDRDFMESVWWVFKSLWDKGLIYESYRTMHICPRCETTLSQSEVAEGYKDVKDLAVTVKFELLTDDPSVGSGQAKTYILAWTTTPWTLPGNVALAVNKEVQYKVVTVETNEMEKLSVKSGEKLIFAVDLQRSIFGGFPNPPANHEGENWEVITDEKTGKRILFKDVDVFQGIYLVGKAYKPLFDYYAKDESLKNRENGWKIYHADFVTTEMGTGIAHEAPAFGEDDMQLGKRENLPWVQHVHMDGTMKAEVAAFDGRDLSPKAKGKVEEVREIDLDVRKYLGEQGLLFASEKYLHSYPHCWRCDTPLLSYATSSWFVNVTEIKTRMLELARNINWSPEHIKAGRFGKWLEGARDWSISRQRYWASVMPIWKCDVCLTMRVFGSVKDLEDASGKKIDDLHKHIVDEVTVSCEKCQGMMQRVPDVLDTWFDSGSMPYAQMHFPFENKAEFDATFPAQFIAEGVDQTRAWFYYQHVIATAIKDGNAFQNVVVNGIVLAEDGKKMSKKLQNYPDPMKILDKYGSDALRYYLLSSPVVAAENLNFSERDLSDIQRNVFRMLWNSYSFFTTYAAIDNWEPKADAKPSDNLLDRWILSELQLVTREVNAAMEAYELNRATRAFGPFVDNLSNWYIRRSRKRFWKSEDDGDKEQAYQTLYEVLKKLSLLMAPFTPFLSEEIYRNLTGEESVHLAEYPVADESLVSDDLNAEMEAIRYIVSKGLELRAKAGIKVRQPLAAVILMAPIQTKELENVIVEELNVKSVRVEKDPVEMVGIDTNITPELKLEMEAREIIRAIQEGRKKAGFNVEDRISLGYTGKDSVFANTELAELIAHEVLATSVQFGVLADADYSETVDIEGESFAFTLQQL